MNQKEIDEGFALVGTKIKEAIDSLRASANRTNIKASEAEDAWCDHDWLWLMENNVVSRGLYEYIHKLDRYSEKLEEACVGCENGTIPLSNPWNLTPDGNT